MPFAGAFRHGSNGTRTRDLPRDRPAVGKGVIPLLASSHPHSSVAVALGRCPVFATEASRICVKKTSEHYHYWQEKLGRVLPWGRLGENLTVALMPLEDEVAIGDRLRIDSAEFVVAQPRLPCFKLGIRFNDAAMVKYFLSSGRSGY